jgi:transposase
LPLIRGNELPSPATPTVLGVDDFAWKKGQAYGTILVDLELQQVVDLLPDRSADSLAEWLLSGYRNTQASRSSFSLTFSL